jgi:hypothetical protein
MEERDLTSFLVEYLQESRDIALHNAEYVQRRCYEDYGATLSQKDRAAWSKNKRLPEPEQKKMLAEMQEAKDQALIAHKKLTKFAENPATNWLVTFTVLDMWSSQCGSSSHLPVGSPWSTKTLADAAFGRLGDVPSRFMYPVTCYRCRELAAVLREELAELARRLETDDSQLRQDTTDRIVWYFNRFPGEEVAPALAEVGGDALAGMYSAWQANHAGASGVSSD